MPSIPLRPSHSLSIFFWVCAAKSASTQPVSLLVPLPLPQSSSGPENVVLFAESWQDRLVVTGSFIEKVLPDCVVARGSGLGPLYEPVPVPAITCSWVPSTLPVAASTYTDRLEGSFGRWCR